MKYHNKKNRHFTLLVALLLISMFARTIFASIIELGNDEVYYRIFALFPQLSYYDHPPLLSTLIRLTTFGNEISSEFLVRLSSIIIGTLNTYIIYIIARKPIFDSLSQNITEQCERDRRGLFAAMLYTGSVYASVIVGIFIMPDTPLSLFWLLAIYCFTDILPKSTGYKHKKMLLAGLFIGLAMLSKYSGLYLWGAAGLYIILFNRALLKKWSLWIAVLITIVTFLPVIIWNVNNDFISFTFHSARVVSGFEINWISFGREIVGGFLYNNPINYILIITALATYYNRKKIKFLTKESFRFLLCFSLPMILIFLYISVTKDTLPHWAAPAYFTLIVLSSCYLAAIKKTIALCWIRLSVILTLTVLIIGVIQINLGWLMGASDTDSKTTIGQSDVTLDMYGWSELEQEFSKLYQSDIKRGIMPASGVAMYSALWFEAAHLDSYVALRNNIQLKTIAPIEDSHLYDWITVWRGGIDKNQPAYIVATSRFFMPDSQLFTEFEITLDSQVEEIPIYRNDEIVEYFFIYRINALREVN